MQGTGARYTSKRLPVKLAYLEYYKRVTEAFAREKQIQRWTSSKKHSLVTGAYRDLHAEASCRNITHFKFRNFREV